MSVRQSLRQGGKSPLRPLPILGSLLLALTQSPRAHAVTTVTVDGARAAVGRRSLNASCLSRSEEARPGEYVASAHVLTMVMHAIPNSQAKNILSR